MIKKLPKSILPSAAWKVVISLVFLFGLLGLSRLFTYSAKIQTNDDLYQKYFNDNYKIFAVNIPDDLNFSGEQVPIQDFEVRERIDREFLVNTYWQSSTLLLAKRSNRWFPVITPILKRNGIPEDFKYLAVVESGFMHGVSSKGAAGYWQFIPSTAKAYGLRVDDDIDERYHVEKSTEAACRFFKDSYKELKSWTLVAAAFNMGINGVQRQLIRQQVDNYYDLLLNEETARYVFRILAMKEILGNPRRYGFVFRKKDLYPAIPVKKVKIDTSITNLPAFAETQGINYKLLKYFNPWIRTDELKVKSDESFTLSLPGESVKDYSLLMRMADAEMGEPVIPTTETDSL
ncbi:MAG: lytic transglycosylase domain-containing protein [Bacteroidia bacterium]